MRRLAATRVAVRPGSAPAREYVGEVNWLRVSGSRPAAPAGPPGVTGAKRRVVDRVALLDGARRPGLVSRARRCGSAVNRLFDRHREAVRAEPEFTRRVDGGTPVSVSGIRSGDRKRTIAPAPLGTRRMSLPIISAAQKRDSRGNYFLAALLRSFVNLLAACPQESGVTALILARFRISPPAVFTAAAIGSGSYRPLSDSHSTPGIICRLGRTAQSLTSIS